MRRTFTATVDTDQPRESATLIASVLGDCGFEKVHIELDCIHADLQVKDMLKGPEGKYPDAPEKTGEYGTLSKFEMAGSTIREFMDNLFDATAEGAHHVEVDTESARPNTFLDLFQSCVRMYTKHAEKSGTYRFNMNGFTVMIEFPIGRILICDEDTYFQRFVISFVDKLFDEVSMMPILWVSGSQDCAAAVEMFDTYGTGYPRAKPVIASADNDISNIPWSNYPDLGDDVRDILIKLCTSLA